MSKKFHQNKQDVCPALLDYVSLLKHYNLSKSTISKLVMKGEFTDVVRIGVKAFFRKKDVDAWILTRIEKASVNKAKHTAKKGDQDV